MSQYLVIDLETGIREVHGRKGNFYYNKIVAVGLKNGMITDAFMESDPNYIMQTVPNSIRILVGHNIKYDLLYLWKSERFQYMLQEGLKIFDTQLAHYMLSGQQEKYPALREIAVRCYGQPEREKLMEPYWEKGIDTKDIPNELVLKDVTQDVLDTEQIMLQQVKRAKKEGMYKLIMEQMEGLLATTEMEFNGMYINREVFEKNRQEVRAMLESKQKEALELASKYWR